MDGYMLPNCSDTATYEDIMKKNRHVLFVLSDIWSGYYLDGKLVRQDIFIDTDCILSALNCCECGTTEVKALSYSMDEYNQHFGEAGYPEQATALPDGIGKHEL